MKPSTQPSYFLKISKDYPTSLPYGIKLSLQNLKYKGYLVFETLKGLYRGSNLFSDKASH